MSTENQKSFTFANILAIVGFALLGVFTFLGHSYLSGGEIALDILFAVLSIAVSGGLLFLMIKARKAENDLDKWKIIEIAVLVVYIIFALYSGYKFGLGHFFAVNSNKEKVKEIGQQDIDRIKDLFTQYYDFETSAIAKTYDGLNNAVYSHSTRTPELNDFISSERFEATKVGVDTYKKRMERELIGAGYKAYVNLDSVRLCDIEGVISSWSMINIPFQAKKLEDISINIGNNLTNLSNKVKLPIIVKNTYNSYTIDGFQSEIFGIEGGIESLKFKQALKENGNMTFSAWLAIIVINILILLPYLTARRTLVLRSKAQEIDGGMIIK